MNILGIRVLVTSELADSVGGGMIIIPSDLYSDVDDELTQEGLINPGQFIQYINVHGAPESIMKSPMTDHALANLCNSQFPDKDWMCCRRHTSLNSYHIIVAFGN